MRFGTWTLGGFGLAALSSAMLAAAPAQAQTLFADTVIEYRKSGLGPLPEPYGGKGARGKYPYRLPDLSFAFDRNPNSAVSLPRGASLAVGFSGGFIFDGPGDDLFISELGASKELADVFVSSDFGRSWRFLGRADGGRVTRFDFRRYGIRGRVNAVKIVGLDLKGTYPGFDVAYVEGLRGSIRRQPQAVPPKLGGRTGGAASGIPVQRAPAAGTTAADRAHQRKMEESRARARREMGLQVEAEGAAGQRAAQQEAARQQALQAQRAADARARQRAAERAREEAARQGSGSGGALLDLLNDRDN